MTPQRSSRPTVHNLLAAADTPLADLVPGLNDVAGLPIPYGHLPKRARTAYAGAFLRWADLAGQTPAELGRYPGAGTGTVTALLQAVLDAAARVPTLGDTATLTAADAVHGLLAALSTDDRHMLTHLCWNTPRHTRAGTAARMGRNEAWVHRHFPRARTRFTELLQDPAHHQVSFYAHRLRDLLGPYVPATVLPTALHALNVAPGSAATQVLLHVAGPYEHTGEWLENPTAGGRTRLADAVDHLLAIQPAATESHLTAALTAAGLPANCVPAYLRIRTDLRLIGDVYVRWGSHAVHHVEAVLHARRDPASIAEIRAVIGAEHIAAETIRPILQSYPHFHRATRTRWALRSWNLPQYRGIFTEIAARIDAAGGAVNTADLVADLRAQFPDIAESSIYANLDALAFVNRGGVARRRTDGDPWPTPRDPFSSVRGAFRRGRREIRFALVVDDDVLRGSGRPIPPAVAVALGLRPGDRRLYRTPLGQTPVSWRMDSTHGPGLGSTQALAAATAARLGDTLVVIFGLTNDTLDGLRIPARTPAAQRLALLLGRDTLARSVLAASMDCRPDEIEAVLTKRGETALARVAKRLPDHLPR